MRYFSKTSVVLCCIPALLSCTVKENRMPCPCYVDFEPMPGLEYESYGSFVFACTDNSSRTPELTSGIKWYQALERTHNTSVSKGIKSMAVIEGLNRSKIQEDKIIIPLGEQADSLRCYTTVMNCFRETVVMPVDSTKHFATVTLDISDIGQEEYPYMLRVRGEVNGFNFNTMEPVWGDFYHEPHMNNRNQFIFRLPRQFPKDGMLYLDLCEKQNYDIRHEVLATLRLSTLIDSSGYDWTRPCLQDINIRLTYAVASIGIIINDWETIIYSEEI